MVQWRGSVVAMAAGALGLTLLAGVPAAEEAQAADKPLKIVALGDSVMAGFGYYPTRNDSRIDSNLPEMSAWQLNRCRPDFTPNFGYNGACSSNVLSDRNSVKRAPDIDWSPDYGYWNQIAWSAQFAREVNKGHSDAEIADAYRNFALSGSEAAEWGEGRLRFKPLGSTKTVSGLDAVVAEDPDIVTITVGANPTLARMLFGDGNRCRFVSDQYSCFLRLIKEDKTPEGLRAIYRTVLSRTDADVVVMLYPNIVPAVTLFTSEQILVGLKALNTTISEAVADVSNDDEAWESRIAKVYRHFNTGLPPGTFSEWDPCFGAAARGKGVDGRSNQSSATQAAFRVTRAVSGWCKGTPWIISGDTGIHPNRRGYEAMAGQAVSTYKSLDVARILPVLTVSSPPPTAAVLGREFAAYRFTATARPAAILTLAQGSKLPPGLSLSAAGVLGGVPTVAGTYTFRVSASNGVDNETAVSDAITIVVGEAPSAPRRVTAMAGSTSALVTWAAPARRGSSPVTSYVVTAAPGGAECTAPRTARSCVVTGLDNGTRFTFTVRARNDVGRSPASEATRAVTPRKGSVIITAGRGDGSQQAQVTVTGWAMRPQAERAVVVFRSPQGRVLDRQRVAIARDGSFTATARITRGLRVVATVAGVASNAVEVGPRKRTGQ